MSDHSGDDELSDEQLDKLWDEMEKAEDEIRRDIEDS